MNKVTELGKEHSDVVKQQKSKNIIAYFDFDGTLSTHDTLIPFLLHVVGYIKFMLNLPRLLPIVLSYITKRINNEVAKERTITVLLKGYPFELLDRKAHTFATHHLGKYIKPDVFAKLEYHKEHGHTIILVSANLGIYLRYFAKLHELDYVIGTELEFVDKKVSGHLATPNCYGIEKVIRIKRYLAENGIVVDYSYGYGNSRGDFELLDYVDEGYWVEKHDFLSWKTVNKRS